MMAPHRPETALWDALNDAGPDGVAVAELLAITGMTRPTLYRHLQQHASAGRAVQVARGYWRAGPPTARQGTDGHPAAMTRSDRQAVTDSDRKFVSPPRARA